MVELKKSMSIEKEFEIVASADKSNGPVSAEIKGFANPNAIEESKADV